MSKTEKRNIYSVDITVNERTITSVEISQHYKEKHAESIDDALIIKLTEMLDKGNYPVDSFKGEFKFYKVFLSFKNRRYKLIWTLEDDKLYIGILTAHRSEQKE